MCCCVSHQPNTKTNTATAQGEMEEAAAQLAICVNDDAFLSPKGTTKHALWMRLCDMCAKHPQAVSRRLKVDAIIRSGLARFTDETGKGWLAWGEVGLDGLA